MTEKKFSRVLLLFWLLPIFCREAMAVKLSMSGSVSVRYVSYLSLIDSVKSHDQSYSGIYNYCLLLKQRGTRKKYSGVCPATFWLDDAGQLQYTCEIDSVSQDSAALVGAVFVLGNENEKIINPSYNDLFAHQRAVVPSDIIVNHPLLRRSVKIYMENPDSMSLAAIENQELNLVFSDSCSIQMKYIPAGVATIGTDDKVLKQIVLKSQNVDYLNEIPLMTMNIADGFWISETEIANNQYEHYLKERGTATANSLDAMREMPVTNVDWYEAESLCKWLSEKLPGFIVQLPHEVEWEYAARGSSRTRYPWQRDEIADTLANYGQKYGHLFQIHSFYPGASSFGVLHMSGNVYEWCLNPQFDYKDASIDLNAAAAVDTTADNRAVRGGSFVNSEFECRVAARYFVSPYTKNDYIGFRIVMKKRKS